MLDSLPVEARLGLFLAVLLLPFLWPLLRLFLEVAAVPLRAAEALSDLFLNRRPQEPSAPAAAAPEPGPQPKAPAQPAASDSRPTPQPEPGPSTPAADESDDREAAREFLRRRLAHGPVPVRVLVGEAEKLGICRRTVYRARTKLGLKSVDTPEGRAWSL